MVVCQENHNTTLLFFCTVYVLMAMIHVTKIKLYTRSENQFTFHVFQDFKQNTACFKYSEEKNNNQIQ